MSRRLLQVAIAGLAVCSLNSSIYAQQPASRTPDAAASLQDQASTANDPQVQQRSFLRASSLIGVPIQGTGDVRLGVVGDILIDPATYEFRYVLVDTGVGVGTSGLPVIPWILFQPPTGASLNSGTLTIPLTAQRLTQVPTVGVTDAQIIDDAPWVASVDEFFASDLLDRRVSRPDFNRASVAQPNGRMTRRSAARPEGLDASPSGTENAGTPGNPANPVPGTVDNIGRNRGPATVAPGSVDNVGRNRGPATRAPGSVDNRGRNRGPANTTPGGVDNSGRNRGPANTSPGATGSPNGNSAPSSPITPATGAPAAGSGSTGTGAAGASGGQ